MGCKVNLLNINNILLNILNTQYQLIIKKFEKKINY